MSDPTPDTQPAYQDAPLSGGGLMPPANTTVVSATNPLLTIFLQPRATIRHVVNTNPELHLWVLIMFASFFNILDRASGRNMGDRLPVWGIFAGAIVLAPIAVPLSLIGAWILEWAGGKLGGVATREEVRAAIAWANVPVVAFGFIYWPLVLTLFGTEVFREEMPRMSEANGFLVLGLGLTAIVTAIWSVVTAMKVFAEVHQFSVWRAIGAWLLLLCAILVPLLVIAVVSVVIGRGTGIF